MVQTTLDEEVRAAARLIFDKAEAAANQAEPVVIALPHQPQSAKSFKTGYAFVDGTEWWSKKRPAPAATEFKTKVTMFLRQFCGARVVSLHQSITLEDWRAVAEGFLGNNSKPRRGQNEKRQKKRAV